MEVTATGIEGVLLVKPKVWGDERGYFVETWQRQRYATEGMDLPFVQDNHSMSRRGCLRGLHFQKKHPQGKLVMVSLGQVFDVAVDIRPGSPTFGQWYGTFRGQPAPALDRSGAGPRLCRAERCGALPLQMHRLLPSRRRRLHTLG